MKNISERPACHRAEDLVTYLYGEATTDEARDFALHMRQCDACRAEFNLFNDVHDSIVVWRKEVLGPLPLRETEVARAQPTLSPAASWQPRKVSAVAALRQFFAVSPLWLRGATAFAGVLLCALLVFAVMRWERKTAPVASNPPEAKYSQNDFDRAVKAKVDEKLAQINQNRGNDVRPTEISPSSNKKPRTQMAANRVRTNEQRARLTAEERVQLAADLGLIPGRDEEEPFVLPDQPNP